MKNKEKLNKLQAIAQSVVKKEAKRVNEAIKQKSQEKPNNEKIEKETVKFLVKGTKTANDKRTLPTTKEPEEVSSLKREQDLPKIKPLLNGKRFQAVFKDEDLNRIKKAKIYLLQNGHTNVSSNGIIQAALRVLEHDLQLVDTYKKILDEDHRRKSVLKN